MSSFDIEHGLLKKGYQTICGIDEAGRGPFAGPVSAAAVILPIDCEIVGLDDSKKIKSEKKRQDLYNEIIEKAIDYSVVMIDNQQIDKEGILVCTFKAMRQAVLNLKQKPDYLLVDGNLYRNFDDFSGECVIKGDSLSLSISAASILAKVTRDNYMNEQAKIYPIYDFEHNKGYGSSKKHQQALIENGHCEIHRIKFLEKLYAKNNCNW